MSDSAPVPVLRFIRLQLEDLGVVGDGLVPLAQVGVGAGALEPDIAVIRFQVQGLGEVGYGLIEIAQSPPGVAPV